jgi:aspartate racemase
VTKTLGLIGGLGTPAGIYYYQRIAMLAEARGQPLHLMMAHADVRTVMRHVRSKDIAELNRYLYRIIDALCAAGADVAAISAVTPHAGIAALRTMSPIPIVSVLDAVRLDLLARHVKRVALLGSRAVIESDLFGCLSNITVIRPTDEEISAIAESYTAVAVRGSGTPDERDDFVRVAKELWKRERLDAIVIAGTDLSPLFDSVAPEFPSFDCSEIHIRAIAERLLES